MSIKKNIFLAAAAEYVSKSIRLQSKSESLASFNYAAAQASAELVEEI